MLRIRHAADRGHFNHGWLDTFHTFSFSEYYDPAHTQFRSLRVMNEDRVAAGQGFGMHGHRDMEILTFVLRGALQHKDSLGNGEVLRPGEVQQMTAGSGIRHSEFNPSDSEEVHLYQVWLLPEKNGLPPGYAQKKFDEAGRDNQWQTSASHDGRDGSLVIHQDATISRASLATGKSLDYALDPRRHAWLQILAGDVTVAGNHLHAGDGLAVSDEAALTVQADSNADLLLFDMA
ncbi:pirin family protein [Anatilimnocola floriformis]|uniref:pirin family protein n=1 Tax=Anatilimnocola floriformis TaxID=2948575 RepID=UPI0020C368E9|nr:pirin family protein [Anatilimnocola floriformis]